MGKSLSDYVAVYEWHVVAYGLILATFFVKFLLSLFTHTPVSILYSSLLCLFFLVNILFAGYSIFVNSDKPKFVYAYSLLPQVILIIVFVVLLAIYVKPVPIDPEKLDGFQTSLECCGLNPKNLPVAGANLTTGDENQTPNNKAKSCCPKLDADGNCTPELAWKDFCDDKYADKVRRFKARAIVLSIVTALLQCLLFFSFCKRFLV